MRLIDAVRKHTDNSEDYIVDTCCPSSFGPEYDKYETECHLTICSECWNQEYQQEGEEA